MAVADGFDAATTRRSYQTVPIEPDQVLREMWENPKRGYDRVLVKALINLIGVYPVGTCVILDTFEIGIVAAPNPDGQQLNRPLVRIAVDADGAAVPPPGELVNLTEQDETGASAAPSSRSPTPRATDSRSATTLSDSRLAPAWAALRAAGRTALIPYLTAGYPDRDASEAALRAAADGSPTSSRSACRSAIRWPTGPPSSAPPSRRSDRA